MSWGAQGQASEGLECLAKVFELDPKDPGELVKNFNKGMS